MSKREPIKSYRSRIYEFGTLPTNVRIPLENFIGLDQVDPRQRVKIKDVTISFELEYLPGSGNAEQELIQLKLQIPEYTALTEARQRAEKHRFVPTGRLGEMIAQLKRIQR